MSHLFIVCSVSSQLKTNILKESQHCLRSKTENERKKLLNATI